MAGHIGMLESYKSDLRTELKNIHLLSASETLKPEGNENPLPLIEWGDYQNQNLYFTWSIHNATMGQVQEALWLTFPIVQTIAAQKGLKFFANSLGSRNISYNQRSPLYKAQSQWWAEFRVNQQMKQLKWSLKELKNPKSLELPELYSHYQKALSQAKTLRERQRIETAYEKVVFKIGERVEYLSSHPQLLQNYAQALFGKNGSTTQLRQIQDEYYRLLNARVVKGDVL